MKLASIEAIPIRLPRERESALGSAGSPTTLHEGSQRFRWSTTVPALYSADFETALVRITTDSGLTGWGEAQAPLAPEVACEIVRLLLRPAVEGLEFDGTTTRISELWDLMYRTMRVRGQTGGFMLDAISGVDIALWDLAGKMRQKPVSAVIADAPASTVPAYYSGYPGERTSAVYDEGFRTIKIFHDASIPELLARIDALSSRFHIAVDALWRLDLDSALSLGGELDEREVLWLEAPLLPEDVEGHAVLARELRTPIAIGESYRTRYEVKPFVDAGAINILQPDLGRCGITEFLRLAKLGPRVIPHVSIAMGPQIAAAIHVAAACRSELLEFNPNVLTVANRYLAEPLHVQAAEYVVPKGPGLGILPVHI